MNRCLAGSPTSSFLVPFCAPCLRDPLVPKDARSEKSGCSRDERPSRMLLRRGSFFLFFYFTWHRWKKIASPSRDALLEPRKVANKSSVAVEWREKLVRFGETWLSIIRIDMEWKVLVFFFWGGLMINGKSCTISRAIAGSTVFSAKRDVRDRSWIQKWEGSFDWKVWSVLYCWW